MTEQRRLITGKDWRGLLDETNTQARNALVSDYAREALATLAPETRISTAELANLLWPLMDTRESDKPLRQALFKSLLSLARTELADCCEHEGPRTNAWGKSVRPWRWHRPTRVLCPVCGHATTQEVVDRHYGPSTEGPVQW